jgi:hypothetical protein
MERAGQFLATATDHSFQRAAGDIWSVGGFANDESVCQQTAFSGTYVPPCGERYFQLDEYSINRWHRKIPFS